MNQRGCRSVGIDLGTTYSSLAYLDGQLIPRVVADSSGRTVVPSAIFFDDEEILVGDLALQHAKLRADRIVQFIKVHMGEPWRKGFNGHIHTPESLSAIILRHLVQEAEPQIGPISEAVITVPAWFTEKRRRATQQAGEIAGLSVIGTLNEPMAATLAFGLYQTDREQNAVVYDLGGGTFDVTIVRLTPNQLIELATEGNRQLGGRDWDQRLVDYVADDFYRVHRQHPRESPQAMQDLWLECEQAKRQLSNRARAAVRLHAFGHDHIVEITRAIFEEITEDLLNATKLTTELALQDAGINWKDISRVVLVGGSTLMPSVRDMLKRISGKPADYGVNPVMAVALGAALYGSLLETGEGLKQIVLSQQRDDPETVGEPSAQQAETTSYSSSDSDSRPILSFPQEAGSASPPETATGPRVRFVTAHGVGVKVRIGQRWRNQVLIPKNTAVPTSVAKRFTTIGSAAPTQTLRIEVTQGNSDDVEMVETLGSGYIKGLPANEPPGQPVDIEMQFDRQGRLHIHATYVNTGQELKFYLVVDGGLHEEEVHRHRKFLQNATVFPRGDMSDYLAALAAEDENNDGETEMPPLHPID